MTTLAVLADIHGNLPALEAVLADLAQFRVDHVIVAGDVVNWGPFSAQVMERVSAAGWAAIRGNNEYYLLDYDTPRAPAEWADAAQWPLLPWLRCQLGGRHHHQIAAWPDALSLRFPDAPPVRVLHGSPRSNTEGLYLITPEAELAALLSEVDEDYVIAAHTHLPLARSCGRWRVFNPGSVGVPLDGVHWARYLLLEGGPAGWQPTFRRVPFDLAAVLHEFERQAFSRECGVLGRLVVAEFERARLEIHPFVAWRRACRPGAPIDPALLAEYARVDRRQYMPRPYVLAEQGRL